MRRTWQHYRDSSKLAADVPREAVDDLIDHLASEIESVDLFFTSGSMDGDKLEHWKGYGSDQGYSICFQDCSPWRLRSYDETPAKELEPTSPFLRWQQVDYAKFEPSFSRPLATSSGRAMEGIISATVGRRDGAVDEQQGHRYAFDQALRQLCWHKHTGYESEEEIRIAVQDPPPATRRTRQSAYGPRTIEYVELVAADPMALGAAILAAGEPGPAYRSWRYASDRETPRPSWPRTSMPLHDSSTKTATTFPFLPRQPLSSGDGNQPHTH
jgi:hypothetical protein